MSISTRPANVLTALFLAVIVFAAPIGIAPAEASPADSYSGPHFGAGNLPSGCIADMSKPASENFCYHMRTDLNALDSPKVDVLVMVPVSPTAERDMRIMRQSVEMWEAGIDYLALEMGLDWLANGMDFHISVDYFDPVGGEGGEFTTYPIVDPEIVVIASNPVGGAGIGIDPVDFVFTNENLVPCHNVANPFDFEHWENLPGFNSHHEERSGTYVEDCDGKGGNICFAINGAIDPDPTSFDIFGLFDLVSHEFGHCLTVGHVGDGAEGAWRVVPTNDIMAYNDDPVGLTKCVSTLDVEGVALRMSKYLDVNGDAVVNNKDLLVANDPIGVGDPFGEGSNPFQVQHPDDHLYASSSGDPNDCPQPDVGVVPGPRTDWTPEGGGGTEPELTIASPADGATVPAGVIDVSGTANRDGGGQGSFTAILSGPEEVANGASAGYSVGASNAQGPVTCTISAEGSPVRTNESADGCSVELTWAEDGTYAVTGEATDGTSTDADTLAVTVTTPSGLPDPDGSIAGGITMFADANPFLATNEAAALATSPVDPAPKFLPGESVTFHTRFTEDATGAVAPAGDTFKWHIWNAAGEPVGTMPCVTSPDSDLTAPNGFDCEASAALPSDLGRYYTTLQYTKDGRWSCHGAGPLENLVLPSGIPECLKAFDIVANTSAANPGSAPPLPREAIPYFIGKGTDPSGLTWAMRGRGQSFDVSATAVTPPSQVPEDPEIEDSTGDALQLTNPGAGVPVDHLDVEAAWFDNDADFLYVGLKLVDIPADPNSTAFAAYHVNFKPNWIADPKQAFGVPAASTYTGLRVQGMFSPVGFNGLTPGTETTHRAELQVLSTSATGNNFAKIADLQQLSVDPDSDIVWWAVPRTALKDPQAGDALESLSADTALAMRGRFTLRSDLGTAAEGRTFRFLDGVEPLVVSAGGPYSGAVATPISISGSATGGTDPYTCAWSGSGGASFADASACDTTVSFTAPGSFTIDLTVTDGAGSQASTSAQVAVEATPAGERVEVYLDGATLAGTIAISTGAGNPTAEWSVPTDLAGLSGEHSVTARWFDADDTLLSEDSITLTVEPVGPEFEINITSPGDGDEVGSDFIVEGTTSGTAAEERGQQQGGRLSPSAGHWKRANIVVDRLENLEKLTSHGPPIPADSVGIGPGSTLITNFFDPVEDGNFVGICTAAFIFRDPNTSKVYIGAAGHCFIGETFTATHGPGADWDRANTRRVRVCVSTCLGGASGLGTAAFGVYPSVTRDLGPLAYARQTLNAVDIGNDFGIVEIPPALYDEIRTDLPVWNGPDTSTFQPLTGGRFVAQYGNGIGLGEVFPTKARMGIGAGSNASRWIAAMATTQGDSGSAVVTATATVGTDTSVEGESPVGMLTHLTCCLEAGNPYTTAGTTVPRALQMAQQDAGINLELIHDVAQLAVTAPQAPTGLTATAGDGSVGLSWTAPSNGGAPITKYTVKWGTQAGGPYPNTTDVTGTQATIEGLTNGVTYHFVVSATNSAGEGPNSTEVSATPTRLTTVPGAPTGLTGLAGDGQVALSWQAPADDGGSPITGYTVKFGPNAGGPYPNTITVTDTATTVTGLTNDVTYYFVVSATNENGAGPESNEVEATPRSLVSPFTVEVRVLGAGAVLEEWTAVDSYDGSAWAKQLNDVPGGEVTVEARLLEDGSEVARDSIALIVDATEVTTVAFTDDSADAGRFSDEATVAAKLVDEAGAPIAGAELEFVLTGANSVERWTATTGDNGVGSVTRLLTGAPGEYNLTVNYAGETDVYEPDSDQRFFTIDKEISVTDLVVTGKGKSRTLTATLVEDDGPDLDAGHEIVFFADGTEIGRATTNADGVAVLPAPKGYRGDHFLFEARFGGDDYYRDSSGTYQT